MSYFTSLLEHCQCFPREDVFPIFSLGSVWEIHSLGKYFSVHSLGHSEYQEIHTSSALNIDSVKINTSLQMMREWVVHSLGPQDIPRKSLGCRGCMNQKIPPLDRVQRLYLSGDISDSFDLCTKFLRQSAYSCSCWNIYCQAFVLTPCKNTERILTVFSILSLCVKSVWTLRECGFRVGSQKYDSCN